MSKSSFLGVVALFVILAASVLIYVGIATAAPNTCPPGQCEPNMKWVEVDKVNGKCPDGSNKENGKCYVQVQDGWNCNCLDGQHPDGEGHCVNDPTPVPPTPIPPTEEPKKIWICHLPPGNTDNKQAIEISENAWANGSEGGHASGAHGGDFGPISGPDDPSCQKTTPPPPTPIPACTHVGAEVQISDSGWVLAGDGLSRTETWTYGKPDLDYSGYCDTRTTSKTEYLTLYCVNNETVSRWPSEMGDATPGVCQHVTLYTAQATSSNSCDGWSRGYDIFADGVFMSHTDIDSGSWPGASVPGNSNYQVTLPDQTVATLALPEMSKPDNCQTPVTPEPPHNNPTPENTPGDSGPMPLGWFIFGFAVILTGALGFTAFAFKKQ